MNAQTTTKQNGFRGASESKDHQVSRLNEIKNKLVDELQGLNINNTNHLAAAINLQHGMDRIQSAINQIQATA